MYYVLNYSQFDNKIYQDFAKYALNPEALINPYFHTVRLKSNMF